MMLNWSLAMNKRTFLKLCAAAMTIPAVSRLLAWAGGERLRNWAGNLEYSTDRLYATTSLEQVRDYA
jgi:xylitol oxidase